MFALIAFVRRRFLLEFIDCRALEVKLIGQIADSLEQACPIRFNHHLNEEVGECFVLEKGNIV